ncbi:uncharacterized protein RCO7_14586 [Rhynchosporium graminicola]|uniref:Uncharacterized protein n=1 Tax=Rhynchosporium graminicola TaxID=2792576 RepID=A0A1E1KQ71_9HELO|nr:uncharacterized protein RCO7_14586 [Rhynchosporium commune]
MGVLRKDPGARTLHFMKEELVFGCLEENRYECKIFSSTNTSVKHQHVNSFGASLTRIHGDQGSNQASRKLQNCWRTIVHEYTKLSMTFEKDKLHALSGIAVQIESCRGDTHLAGLWSSSSLQDLCRRTMRPVLQSRPKIWRAPSWSWAAVNNSEAYGHHIIVDLQHAEVHSFICDAAVIEDYLDTLGRLTSGYAELSGTLHDRTLFRKGSNDSETNVIMCR